MRRLSMLATCLLLFGCFTGTSRAAQNSIIGDWVGGVQIRDKWFIAQGGGGKPPFLTCKFGYLG